jgi:hypothetical protein
LRDRGTLRRAAGAELAEVERVELHPLLGLARARGGGNDRKLLYMYMYLILSLDSPRVYS